MIAFFHSRPRFGFNEARRSKNLHPLVSSRVSLIIRSKAEVVRRFIRPCLTLCHSHLHFMTAFHMVQWHCGTPQIAKWEQQFSPLTHLRMLCVWAIKYVLHSTHVFVFRSIDPRWKEPHMSKQGIKCNINSICYITFYGSSSFGRMNHKL